MLDNLEGLDLVRTAISIVPYTPYFLVGTIPAIAVIVSKNPQDPVNFWYLMASGIVLLLLLLWMGFLWFTLDRLYFKFEAVA